MVTFIKQWVVNIAALALLIAMLEILLPKGRVKKMVSLVTDAVLVFCIVNPLLNAAGKKFDFTSLHATNSIALDKLQVEKEKELLEDGQMKQIVDVYRLKIIEQIEQNALEVDGVKKAGADIIFNEDYDSKSFGEIKRIYLEIDAGTGDKVKNGSISIDRVEAGEVKKMRQVEEYCDPVLKQKLEEKIGHVFGVNSENIIISQKKR